MTDSPRTNSGWIVSGRTVLGWTVSGWTVAICLGAVSSVPTQAAWAKPVLPDTTHFLVAQQVVDGLPPPPPLIFGQESLANNQFQAQQPQQYVVVVNGDSQELLSQVQLVQPTASVQEYNGQRFIQAGLFTDLASAQQQVTTLGASGVTAQVMSISSTPQVSQAPATGYGTSTTGTYDPNGSGGMLPPPEVFPTTTVPAAPGVPASEVEFGSTPTDPGSIEPREPRSGRSYFVVIPGGGRNVEAISSQVSRLTSGMGIDDMIQTSDSKGSHVRVGPFNSRSAANRWTRYFRDFGMDARVSFGR